MRVRTFIFGAAVGAAVAYFTDPVAGRGRRTRLRDQAISKVRRARLEAERKARYTRTMAEGRLVEMASPGPDDPNPDDGKLEERIRSTVFGAGDVPSSVTLEVADGTVRLRGEVGSTADVERIRTEVAAVPGVRDVESLLHLPGEEPPNKAASITASRRAARSTRRATATTEPPNRPGSSDVTELPPSPADTA